MDGVIANRGMAAIAVMTSSSGGATSRSTIAAPDTARHLMEGRGWTAAQRADWLADVLTRTLLDDADG